MGSREDVAARIDADTKVKITEMEKAVHQDKEKVDFILTKFELIKSLM